jgi:hypothetical protein
LVLLSGIGQAGLLAQPSLSADEVIQRAVARAQEAEARADQSGYTYTKVSVTEELDATGRVKERKEKVYQVFFQAGSTYLKLLEVNGHRPGEADVRKQSENEINVRQLLGQSNAAGGDNRENFLTPELVSRFAFMLVGQSSVNGRLAYQVAFQPKIPAPPVHRTADRLLNCISGTIWIDAEEFEMARVEIRLRSKVDVLGGMAGCLKKLAFTLIRTRVADGVWLNSFLSGDLEGRKLFDSKRIKTKAQSSNFRPLAMGGAEEQPGN